MLYSCRRMRVEGAEAALAYTYAWWLTGDEQQARTAVLAAIDRPDVPDADPSLRLEILLRRTRAAAISAPTMCPASELALLHDAIGVSLDSAAGLTHIDPRDARTELAHGRLEALGVDVEITEPERLGGLAVGNPADVAAARQNPELAQLREQLLAGREELLALSQVEVPPEVLRAAQERWETPTPQPEEGPADEAADEALEEIDLRPHVTPPTKGHPAGPPRRRPVVVGVAILLLLVLAAVVALVVQRDAVFGTGDDPTEEEPTGAPTVTAAPTDAATEGVAEPDEPTTEVAPEPTPSPTATPTPTPTPTPTEEGLVISDAAVRVGLEGEPDRDNPVADPFDPVSVEVTYSGATTETVLEVVWTVDDQPFRTVQVGLSPLRESQRFGEQVPDDGWPAGQHVLALTVDGEVLAEVRFQVAPRPTPTPTPTV